MTAADPVERRRPVITDVARLADVSHQTVSRVLNDSPHVRAVTRERVLAAINLLGYRPSSAAQALVTGRSRTLGVVSIDTSQFGPASTLIGIERAAHQAGYFVSIMTLKSSEPDGVEAAIDRLQRQGVDGILVVVSQQSMIAKLARLPTTIPIVAVQGDGNSAMPSIAAAQTEGAARATEYLLSLGHRTVWHVSGPADWVEAQQRVRGWQESLEASGAPVPPVIEGDWTPGSGYRHGLVLARDPDVTAIFAANDQMALGVLRALHECGRSVPADVSVVGFDDLPEAAYFTPPLTTMRQDFFELGRSSLHVLLDELEGGHGKHVRVTVPVELIVRDSTTRITAG